MTKFQGNVAAMLLLLSALVAGVSSAMAEPAFVARRILGTESDLDVEQGTERRVLASLSPMYGGRGGAYFSDLAHANVAQLVFRCGDAVDQIITTYTDGNYGMHGGNGGDPREVLFNFANPVTISVYTGPKPDSNLAMIVRGIVMQQDGKKTFNCGKVTVVPGGSFATLNRIMLRGFFGRSGKYVDALGIYYN